MIITKQHQGMVTLTAYITTATVSDLAEKVIANISTTLNFAGTDLKTCPATLKYGTTALTAANTAQAVATDP